MSELEHSFIKLFGKTIIFSPTQVLAANDAASDHNLCSAFDSDEQQPDSSIEQEQNEEPSTEEPSKDDQEDDTSGQITDPSTLASNNDNPKTPSEDVETSSLIISKNGEDGKSESVTPDKTFKKPDKILPCPRCNSMDTKFCYYNNYNVNQPRHFCKKCQRYWTAGGTMRNVPVGAGRRKNKNYAASHYRPIMVADAFHMARMNVANGVHNIALRNNGTVLTFGSDYPLCDDMASVLNLAEKAKHCVQNGIHRPDQRVLVPCGGNDNEDDHSSACGSSTTTSSTSDKVGNSGLQEASVIKNYQGFTNQVPCFPGPPWPCAWNSVQWNSPAHQSTLSPPSYPVSFYPAPTYWGMGCSVPGSWNVHCVSPPPSFLDTSAPNSTPNSTVLGKHSRDGKMLNPANSEKEEPGSENSNSERSLWIPKTLRIDDPSEAAKSSIWATLRIRNEKTGSMAGGLFNSFQLADNENNQAMGGSAALHANPAALSRSLNFHEIT